MFIVYFIDSSLASAKGRENNRTNVVDFDFAKKNGGHNELFTPLSIGTKLHSSNLSTAN